MKQVHTFTSADRKTWKRLVERQLPNLTGKASKMFWDGASILNIASPTFPDFPSVEQRLLKATGWNLVSTPVQYSDSEHWFANLHQKHFLITQYIRDGKNLDYTPLPDIFHDAFGHLPLLAIPA